MCISDFTKYKYINTVPLLIGTFLFTERMFSSFTHIMRYMHCSDCRYYYSSSATLACTVSLMASRRSVRQLSFSFPVIVVSCFGITAFFFLFFSIWRCLWNWPPYHVLYIRWRVTKLCFSSSTWFKKVTETVHLSTKVRMFNYAFRLVVCVSLCCVPVFGLPVHDWSFWLVHNFKFNKVFVFFYSLLLAFLCVLEHSCSND